ncbi:hypothetical protein HN873_049286 [Arachis hypogaea]
MLLQCVGWEGEGWERGSRYCRDGGQRGEKHEEIGGKKVLEDMVRMGSHDVSSLDGASGDLFNSGIGVNYSIEELTTRTINAADVMRAHPNHILKKYSPSNLLIVPPTLTSIAATSTSSFLSPLPINTLQQ